MRTRHLSWATSRGVGSLAVALLVGAVLAGCGTSSSSLPASPMSPVLKAGLKAQADGKLVQAVTDYKTVLKDDPANVYALYDLGVIAQRGGSVNDAANYYQKALASHPDYAPALFNLATMEATVAPKQAATLYQRVITLEPKNAGAHLNLGFVLKGLGKTKQGQAQIATALRLDPSLGNSVTTTTGAGSQSTTTTTTTTTAYG
jgi:tetratricopeptide (TPR) repeat protein